MNRLRHILGASAVASAGSAVALALAETLELLLRGAAPRHPGGAIGTFFTTLGFGLVVAAAIGVAGGGLAWWLEPGRAWAAAIRRLRDGWVSPDTDGGADTAPARRIWLPLLGLCLGGLGSYIAIRGTEGFAARELAAALAAVLTLAWTVVVLAILPVVDHLVARATRAVRRVPGLSAVVTDGRWAAVTAGGVAAVAGAVAGWRWRSTLAEIELRGMGYGLAAVISWFVVRWWWLRGAGTSRRPRARWAALQLALLPCAGLLIAALTLEMSTAARAALAHTAVANPLAAALRSASDRDRDGHSAWFGGGDCAPADAFIHPGARDVPANGVDEDCSGADFLFGALDSGQPPVALPPDAPRFQHLVLITVDTLRFDHLGLAGYERDTSPRLDALAAGGASFPVAYTSSPRTTRAVPAILTGRYPSSIAWGSSLPNWEDLAATTPTLAEILARHGFRSAGFVLQRYFDEPKGLFRSMSHVGAAKLAPYYLRDESKPSGHHITDGVIDYLGEDDSRRTFVWAHYYDPHIRFHEGRFGRGKVDLYDESIRYTDTEIGRLLDHIAKGPWADDTLVVFTTDHGQGLGDHGKFGHGSNLYEESMRVPLIFSGAGLPVHLHADVVAETVDIAPTVLELLGIPPDEHMDGRSFAGRIALAGAAPPPADADRTAYMEALPDPKTDYNLRALVRWPHKLIRNVATGGEEAYDLATDPKEGGSILGSAAELEASLREELSSRMARGDWARAIGPNGYVRLEPPEPAIPSDVNLGGFVKVLGVDVPSLRANARSPITLYMTAVHPVPHPWKIRLSIVGDGGCRFTADHDPAGGRHPTDRWQRGEYVIDSVDVRLPKACRGKKVVLYVGVAGKDAPKLASPGDARVTGLPVAELTSL